jgi:hypothetical protein
VNKSEALTIFVRAFLLDDYFLGVGFVCTLNFHEINSFRFIGQINTGCLRYDIRAINFFSESVEDFNG